MKVKTSKKVMIAIFCVSSIVLAGTINDIKTQKATTSIIAKINDELTPVERNLASEEVSRVAQMELPVNEENSKKINATWEITRFVSSDESVVIDKLAHPEDGRKTISVKMELVGNGIVRLDGDHDQEYRVSLLSDFGTIALYKKLGNGYEIIEAKKMAIAAEQSRLDIAEEVELVLERALNQAKSNKVLMGNDISGQVSLNSQTLTGLEVELRNPNGETQNIQIDTADLMDGGAFKAEINGEEVSGVVLNNGKDGYRISFVTGPMAGAMLNFVTKEQLEKTDEEARNTEESQGSMVDSAENEEVQQAAEQVIEERKEVAGDVENQEPVQVLSAEEIKATAEQNGYAF
ncbi:MAG: hypothetical protein KBD76_01875 [Bacteriovorax sp.]|nr:hypothetical protein [Bacteriovorax sp.]